MQLSATIKADNGPVSMVLYVTTAAGVIFRIVQLIVSATYTFPLVSTATPEG